MVASQTTITIIFCAIKFVTTQKHDRSEEFINLINAKQTSWRAGSNFPSHTSFTYIKKLMGTLEDNNLATTLPSAKHEVGVIENLPEHFDPRQKWPYCPSLHEIREQGACSSCWALGAVAAMTDRYCIHSNGTKHFHFSTEDLINCCETCGLGCIRGLHASAWKYWKNIGLVSGGNYNSKQGCKPYKIPPSFNETDPSLVTHTLDASECIHTCDSGYNVDYARDKRRGKSVYYLNSEDQIKADLFKNGPIEAVIEVYEDILYYKDGVYHHIEGRSIGFHSVKIMGWGVENGTKYWLAANCWTQKWGDNGFFKILRGKDHCRVESFAVAGIPIIV